MATRTWTGTSSNLWDVDANWGGIKPSAGDDLVFPASASNKSTSNDIAADTSFNSITFDGIGYTLAGNRITLVAGIIQSITGTTNVISLAIILGATQTVDMQNAGGTLTISGIISDGGSAYGIDKTSAGWLTLSGANTFTGGLTIKAGTVLGTTSTSCFGGSGTGAITLGDAAVNANTTLSGGLTASFANPITVAAVSSGTAIIRRSAPSPTFSGTITLYGNVTFGGTSDGTLIISGAISGTGNITIAPTFAGRVTISNASIDFAGTITNNGTSTGNTTISGGIGTNVTGVIQNSATSQLTLSNAANTFAGMVTHSAGTLNVTQNNEFNIVCDGAANCSLDLNDRNVGTITINKDTTAATVTLLNGWTADSFTLTQGTLAFDSVGNTLTTTTAGGGTGNWTIGANGQVDPTNLDGWTWAVGGNLSLAGDAVAQLNLVATGTWTLTVTGTAVATYVDVAYSDADAGTAIDADDGTNTDSGNNLGWNFGAAFDPSSSIWHPQIHQPLRDTLVPIPY